MSHNNSCTPETQKIIVNMKNNGKSVTKMAENIERSQKLVYKPIRYMETHKMTNNI